MMALCLSAGALFVTLHTQSFTLGWMHSVEKIRWEEDYNVTPQGLQLTQARVKGTGAGMEIPDGAVFRDDSWHYYEKRCNHCRRCFLSEIMTECDNVDKNPADFRERGWVSEYLMVYPEEYVRLAIHE